MNHAVAAPTATGMTLRISRADGTMIQRVSSIYMAAERAGFVIDAKTYRSEDGGMFLSGDLNYPGTVAEADKALDMLMAELGEECTGEERPRIFGALEGPTIIVQRPREHICEALKIC